jgi:hypothetical protein
MPVVTLDVSNPRSIPLKELCENIAAVLSDNFKMRDYLYSHIGTPREDIKITISVKKTTAPSSLPDHGIGPKSPVQCQNFSVAPETQDTVPGKAPPAEQYYLPSNVSFGPGATESLNKARRHWVKKNRRLSRTT